MSNPAGEQPRFLDMGMAPGGFLSAAMERNPGAVATAYSLPVEAGGYEVLLPQTPSINTKMLDITMLAADMGADNVPEGHPDLANFLPRQFNGIREFDVVACGGAVVRNQPRASYRVLRENHRLSATQLALGLGHLRQGGTMVVLLHKPEASGIAEILRLFSRFSSIQLFKSTQAHVKRSAFYMVATNVQVEHPEAVKAVESWKHLYKVATFGSEEEFKQLVHKSSSWAEEMVNNFGPALIRLGNPIWAIQAQALAKAPFTKKSLPASQSAGSWRRESK